MEHDTVKGFKTGIEMTKHTEFPDHQIRHSEFSQKQKKMMAGKHKQFGE